MPKVNTLENIFTESVENISQVDLNKLLESVNIVETIDKLKPNNFLNILGSTLKFEFDTDFTSVKPYFEMQEELTKLALQTREPKNFPWKNSSNIKHPLLTVAATQFGARAYPAIIPGINVVKTKISTLIKDTPELTARARRISTHMDYQLLEETPDWEEGMDHLLSALIPLKGSTFKKTYYDPDARINKSDVVLQDQLIINYNADTVESAYRKSHIFYLTNNKIKERFNSGFYREIELTSSPENMEKKILRETLKISEPVIDKSTPHKFIEMHTWEDLDEDGYEEPWIITFHYETGQIVRINPGFEPSGITQSEDGSIMKIEQIQYFTKYGFIPNPESKIYDLGFNVLIGPLVETMNTIINQLVNSGTLQTIQGGFISKNFLSRGGQIRFKMGQFQKVNVFGEDIKKGIYPLPTKEPSNVLFLLLGFIEGNAKDVASVKDILLGENPGQNQKVGTTNAVLEQGLKTFGAIHKRTHRSLKKELKKFKRLNALFLDEQKFFRVLGTNAREEIGRKDYTDEITITPVSDANIATDSQKLLKSQQLLNFIQLGTVNPQEVTKRALEAENHADIEKLLQLPKPQISTEDQVKQAELKLKAQEQQLNFQLESLKLKVQMLAALGKIEKEERESAIKAATNMAKINLEKIKFSFEKREEKEESTQES